MTDSFIEFAFQGHLWDLELEIQWDMDRDYIPAEPVNIRAIITWAYQFDEDGEIIWNGRPDHDLEIAFENWCDSKAGEGYMREIDNRVCVHVEEEAECGRE